MRLYVFALSFVLMFLNVQIAYANPLIGLVIRQGLLAKTAKGAVKIAKENKKGLLYTLFGGAVGGAVGDIASYCVKNKKICKEVLGESWDIVEDMLGVNDDDNVDGKCTSPKIHYRAGNYQGYDKKSAINNAIDNDFKRFRNSDSVTYELIGYKSDDMDIVKPLIDKHIAGLNKQQYINMAKSKQDKKQSIKNFVSMSRAKYTVKAKYKNGNTSTFDVDVSFAADAAFDCYADKDTYVTNNKQEIEQVINQTINNKSETEINNIIEKHITEIEINNYCSNGGKCDELSKEFADEVFKKLDRYDIDKIDRDNCEVKDNKIISCEKAKIKKDGDEDSQEENDETEKGDKDNKINCDASEFHRKICDFVDWYQNDDYQPKDNDNEQTVKDLSDTLKIDDKRVKFNAQCPPDKHFDVTYMGVTKTSKISYTRYCEFFVMLKPFLIGLAGISSVLIITGGIRRG